MTDKLIVSLLQDFDGRLIFIDENQEPVEPIEEKNNTEIFLFVNSDGKRRYCLDEQPEGKTKWSKSLWASPVALAVFQARWGAMEVVEKSFAYDCVEDRESAVEKSEISCINSATKGYDLTSKTGYLITNTDYLWEAKYVRSILSHPTVWNAESQKFNLTYDAFVSLMSSTRSCSFPIVRMYPISYRHF